MDGSFRSILLNNSLDYFLRRKYAADPQFGSTMTFSSLLRNPRLRLSCRAGCDQMMRATFSILVRFRWPGPSSR